MYAINLSARFVHSINIKPDFRINFPPKNVSSFLIISESNMTENEYTEKIYP